jgi:hypothetical protein
MALMLPVAWWFVQSGEQGFAVLDAHRKGCMRLIPMLGLISASALVCYIIASRLLAFSLFGLLSYVEPVLLLGVALLLGEGIKAGPMADLHPDLAGGDGAGVRRVQASGASAPGVNGQGARKPDQPAQLLVGLFSTRGFSRWSTHRAEPGHARWTRTGP